MTSAAPEPTRRALLAGSGALVLAAAGCTASGRSVQGSAAGTLGTNPPAGDVPGTGAFGLGVASGDPLADAVVIWTRLTDVEEGDPADRGVRWEVASDESFGVLVARGTASASSALGHSVHVDVRGLQPGRWYWYRFHTGNGARASSSPVGRTRTADAPDARPGNVTLAFASCQQYEQGYYGAYRAMLAEDVDLVVFLGDYIYESSWGRDHVRSHAAPEPVTLSEYRRRYALYKSDPDLQRMHAAAPWVVTWDDHEVQDDYAADQGKQLQADFVARRAAAYQAWCEHQPTRVMIGMAERVLRGDAVAWADARIYRRVDFSPLVTFFVLDDRQYRNHQACQESGRGGSRTVDASQCAQLSDPRRTLLGVEQEGWLARQLRQAPARWNILAQQTLFARIDREPGPAEMYWTDGWDGYPGARQRLTDAVTDSRLRNPLLLGGDVHANWVCDVKADFARADSPVVATEFCGTSITSQGAAQQRHDIARATNPWVRWANSTRRGYGLLRLDSARATCALRVIDNEKIRQPKVSTSATFVVESGRAGAVAG